MSADDFQDILDFSGSQNEEESSIEDINRDEYTVYGDDEFSDDNDPEDIIVKANKKDGVIQSFDVACSCGKKLRIVIDYSSQKEE